MKGASKRKLTTNSDLPQSVQDETDDQVDYENRNLNDDDNEHDEHDENVENEGKNEGEIAGEIVVPHLAEGYYVIEAVRKKRVRKGVTQYLIKWHGWPESSNTWEPIENLSTCPDVIEAFEESLRPGGNRSNRRRKRNTAVASTLQSKKHQKQQPPLKDSQNQQPQEDSQNQQPQEDSQDQQSHEDSQDQQLREDFQNQQPHEDSEKQEQQEYSHSPDAASYPIPSVKLRVIEEPCRGPCVHGSNTINVAENNVGGTSQNGSAKRSNNTGSFTGSSQIGEEEENKTEFAIHIQDDIAAERVSPENGISNVDDGTQVLHSSPRIGSRRRKSCVVKRFKKDAAFKNHATGKMTAASDVIVLDDSKNDLDSENVVDNPQSLPVITKIVKPVNYSTSIINGTEEVCVSFLVVRSDGEEVVVNNEYLKENNPVLLINFYEQHLRYNNPSE